MKTPKEIEQLAEQYTQDGIYLSDSEKQQTEIAYMTGYTQCHEDRKHFLSKETLDELFDAHDEDDFIQEDNADKKYTEEDMLKAIIYGSSLTPSHAKLYANNYINSLNKQD